MAEVSFSIPVLSLSGRIGNSQMVFYERQGRPFVRAFKQPANPATGDQAAVRAFLSAAAKQWAVLSDADRQAWQDYAESFFQSETGGELSSLSGAQVYNKAAFYLQALGQPLPSVAPLYGPPPPVSDFTLSASSDESEVRLVVEHSIVDTSGLKLLVRVTPPIPSGRTGRQGDLRYVSGIGSESFADLPAAGAEALFPASRFALPDLVRFLAELTIVSADGIPSLSASQTLTRVIT